MAVNVFGNGIVVPVSTPLGFGGDEATAVLIFTGAGVPTSSPPNGSLYLRTDGAGSASLYQRVAGAWVSNSSGGFGVVEAGRATILAASDAITVAVAATIPATAAFTLALVGPADTTVFRVVGVLDGAGSFVITANDDATANTIVAYTIAI